MNEALLIWAYLSLGNFIMVFVPIILSGGFVYFIALLLYGLTTEWGLKEQSYYKNEVATYKTLKSKVKMISSFMVTAIILATFYPSTDDLKWIIGGSLVWNGIEYASDIEGVDKLPENLVGSMNHFLESLQEEETE